MTFLALIDCDCWRRVLVLTLGMVFLMALNGCGSTGAAPDPTLTGTSGDDLRHLVRFPNNLPPNAVLRRYTTL